MKSINILENIKNQSFDELQKEILETIKELENEKNLSNSMDKYQKLIKLNKLIENKFREKAKHINEKTASILNRISKKK